jgi:CRISPR-associated endonuclease Cas1
LATFNGGGGGASAGGGGGGGYGGGGGGGSFVNANVVRVVKTAATNSGAGSVTIAYYVVPPTITGAGGTAYANAGSTADTPFAGVTIGDANLNSSTDALTITLSDANASLSIGASHPAGVTFSNAGGGVYKLTGAAANITSELDALTLNAPATLTGAVDGVEALTFSLSDSDSADSGSPATATQTADIVAPNFTKTFASTGNIQTFTAPTAGYYDITADGAQGGDGFGGLGGAGGLGAMASGAIYLAAGATLEIVVGGAGGASSQGSTGGGGGGGGSFVIETNNGSGAVDVNEVIAGGGGAAGSAGGGGRTQPTGGGGGAAGAAGRGGGKLGGGGGGFTGGAGGTGNVAGQPGNTAGTSFAGGASGRFGGFGGGDGGFGGGGGGGSAGGGGGGYGGGGGGGGQAFPGGGGGSYVNPSATNVALTAATNSGNGLVTIASVAGPKAANGTLTIGHGQTENITSLLNGLVTPGLAGDTETLTAFSATAGTATLANGVATYAAPASGSPTISYTVNDERGATATGSVAVTVDPGPSAASGTLTIGHGQTENITSLLDGLATPGLTGDTETLTAFSATAGTATLANGVATYTAPASGSPTISYTVQDQLGDTATGSVAVTVDPGPSVASGTLTIGHGQTENITSLLSGLATPGLTGDTETLTAFSATAGTATLANGVATYAAPASGSPTISYTVQDQLGDTASGTVNVTIDPGPSAANGSIVVGHGESVNETALVDGLVTPGLAGDTETITAVTGNATLANGVITYTAPASGVDAYNYTVQDQLGDTASGTVNVTIDPGPAAANGSIVVGHGQSVNETAVVDGLVTPGLAGDTETITAVTGNATLTNGVITYTAPASGVDAFNYTVQDQLGDTASGTVNVTIDPGPTITTATPAVVEKGQSTEIGTVAPGLPGDTLTLKQTSGSGALSLRLVGGVEEVIYTAPATVAASTTDAVTYSVNDEFGDTTSGTASIQLDAGPTIAAVTPSVLEQNHSEEIGTIAPGLVGDTLTLNKTSGSGALSLQVVGGVEEVIYTSPAIIASSALDAVTYTVTDQHNDAAATGSSTVPLASGNGAIVVGTAGGAVNVGNGNSAIDGRSGNETINAGNGADAVFAGTNDQITLGNGSDTIFGGSDDTIQTGNGIDAIFAAAYATITGGNGNDSVSAGPYANITLGNGNDTITAGDNSILKVGSGTDTITVGDNSTLKVGNGNDTMTLGPSDAVTVGTGQDTLIYTELGGNNSIAGFLTGKDSLDFSQINPQLSVPNAPLSGNMVAPDSLAWVYQGKNAMIYINDTDNTLASSSLLLTEVTLTGVSWLAEQKVALIRIDWKGDIVCVAGGSGYSANPFRVKWQLETREDPAKRNDFCRSIITQKIEASILTLEKSIRRSDKWERAMKSAYAALSRLDEDPPEIISELRALEANCAAAYFRSWVGMQIKWRGTSRRPIPNSWRSVGARSSPYHLAGNRNAAHPVNAILNYAYATLESEIRIKAISEGYDPTIGIMHEGSDGSSKFIFDLMEPERPKVDRAVLDFVRSHVFDPVDFTIRGDGVVRLNPQLARRMAGLPAGRR